MTFQFHEGPIKTYLCIKINNVVKCFNSMKVRLKQVNVRYNKTPTKFQFHEGPIKTTWFDVFYKLHNAFQFHEGPIKTLL